MLPALGITLEQTTLPTVVDCPFCRHSSLYVCQDTIREAQWHYCTRCNFAGDLIMLAAAVLKVDHRAAMEELDARVSFSLADWRLHADYYVESCCRRYEALHQAWQKAADVATNPPIADLLEQLKLPASKLPRKHIRLLPRSVLKTLCFEKFSADKRPGRDNRYVAVIPHYDLPGRICGLTAVEPNLNDEPEVSYRVIPYLGTRETQTAGVALADFDAKERPPRQLVINDVILGLRLHTAFSRLSANRLPLLAVPPGWRIRWNLLTGFDTAWCSPEPNMWMAQAAKEMEGNLVIGPHEERSAPRIWVNRALEQSKPWQEAAEDMIGKLRPVEAAAWRGRLGMVDATSAGASIRRGKHWYRESEGRWYRDGEMIMDAVLRIDSIVDVVGGGTRYVGRLVCPDGREIPFKTSAYEIEHGEAWLYKLARSCKRTLFIDRLAARDIVSIAQTFQPPEHTTTTTRVGWFAESMSFVFPEFVIENGGRVLDHPSPLEEDAQQPCEHLPRPPYALHPDHLQLLSRPQAAPVWSVLIAILANVLAPALGQRPNGWTIRNSWMKGVAEAAGCIVRDKAFNHVGDEVSWPVVLLTGDDRIFSAKRVACLRYPNYLVSGGSYLAPMLELTGRWKALEGPEIAPGSVFDRRAVQAVPTAYLHDLCVRRLSLAPSKDQWPAAVISDMAAWIDRCGGDGKTIIAGAENIITPAVDGAIDAVMHSLSGGKNPFATLAPAADGCIEFVSEWLEENKLDEIFDKAVQTSGRLVQRRNAAWLLKATKQPAQLH